MSKTDDDTDTLLHFAKLSAERIDDLEEQLAASRKAFSDLGRLIIGDVVDAPQIGKTWAGWHDFAIVRAGEAIEKYKLLVDQGERRVSMSKKIDDTAGHEGFEIHTAGTADSMFGQYTWLRNQGWAVAAHNDYRIDGIRRTFYLWTKGETSIKGEAETDVDALKIVIDKICGSARSF